MVWRCFTTPGPRPPALIEGTMSSALYQIIIYENVRPSISELKLKCSWVMQQDNDPDCTIFSYYYKKIIQDLSSWLLISLSHRCGGILAHSSMQNCFNVCGFSSMNCSFEVLPQHLNWDLEDMRPVTSGETQTLYSIVRTSYQRSSMVVVV